MLLLDDSFSALDGNTERQLFDNLFGHSGIIRGLGITVVLISNSCKFSHPFCKFTHPLVDQFFPTADSVIILQDRKITFQGNWQSFSAKLDSAVKFDLKQYDTRNQMVSSASFDKLENQIRAQEMSRSDLQRKAGDPALYGETSCSRCWNH